MNYYEVIYTNKETGNRDAVTCDSYTQAVAYCDKYDTLDVRYCDAHGEEIYKVSPLSLLDSLNEIKTCGTVI